MRFHAIQNVETALRFLRYKEIKLVNIRGEDIVDGNPKLTLGLIWTIILHFQVGQRASSPPVIESSVPDPGASLSFRLHVPLCKFERNLLHLHEIPINYLFHSVADPDPGSGTLLFDPWIQDHGIRDG
jgi:hypothetical protein